MTLNSQLLRDNELKNIKLESLENQIKRSMNMKFVENNMNLGNINKTSNIYNEENHNSTNIKEEYNNRLFEYCNFNEKNNSNSNNNNLIKNATLIPSFQDINNAVFAYKPNTNNNENLHDNSDRSSCSNIFNNNLKNKDMMKAKLVKK
jgi:hypothetical protein